VPELNKTIETTLHPYKPLSLSSFKNKIKTTIEQIKKSNTCTESGKNAEIREGIKTLFIIEQKKIRIYKNKIEELYECVKKNHEEIERKDIKQLLKEKEYNISKVEDDMNHILNYYLDKF